MTYENPISFYCEIKVVIIIIMIITIIIAILLLLLLLLLLIIIMIKIIASTLVQAVLNPVGLVMIMDLQIDESFLFY